MEVVGTASLRTWIELARERVPAAGPARPHLLARPRRARRGRAPRSTSSCATASRPARARARPHGSGLGRVAVARDRGHARRERRDRRLADARGAAQRGAGREVGRGRQRRRRRHREAIHSGSSWSPTAASSPSGRSRRVFWTDPALGVARYADAGYPEALAEARRGGPRPAVARPVSFQARPAGAV